MLTDNTENRQVSSGAVVTHDYHPLDPEFIKRMYDFYDEVRPQAPVCYSPEYDVYLISRFDDIVDVLKRREVFSAQNTLSPFKPVYPSAQAILDTGFGRQPTFSNCDPPRHTKMRSAAMKCLNPARWKSVEPAIRADIARLVDKIAREEVCDIAADFIFPLTARAGFTLIGFPPEDFDLLLSWCGNRVLLTYGDLSEEEQQAAARDLVGFWSYCQKFVRERNANPVGDLTSDLLQVARESNGDVTVEDVDNMVYSLALASHETTANAMLNGFNNLLRRRDVWNRLKQDRSLIPGAVEELIRLDSPTIQLRRLVLADTQVGGVPIPKGATLVLLQGSGNRDPAQFVAPHDLDIDRANAGEHLAFGKKWHFCLGAPLARFEYSAVLEALLDRLPNLELVADQTVEYVPILLLRAPRQLLVRPNAG